MKGLHMEAIRNTAEDMKREERLANYLQERLPWVLTPTPKFYFTDYHINRKYYHGRESYIGDLELKWLNTPSEIPAIFSYNKLQLMCAVPVYTDTAESYHRVCFRFTDGILLIPAKRLMRESEPIWHTRWDTGETDLVIKVNARDYGTWLSTEVVE
jgi:hypothetical protein